MDFINIKGKFPGVKIARTGMTGIDGSESYKVSLTGLAQWQAISKSLKDIGIGGRMDLKGARDLFVQGCRGYRVEEGGNRYMFITENELNALSEAISIVLTAKKLGFTGISDVKRSKDPNFKKSDGTPYNNILLDFGDKASAEKFRNYIHELGITGPGGAKRRIHERDGVFTVILAERGNDVERFMGGSAISTEQEGAIGGAAARSTSGGGAAAKPPVRSSESPLEQIITSCGDISDVSFSKSKGNEDIAFVDPEHANRFVKAIAGSGVYGAFNPDGEVADARGGRHGFRMVRGPDQGMEDGKFHVYLTPEEVAELDVEKIGDYLDLSGEGLKKVGGAEALSSGVGVRVGTAPSASFGLPKARGVAASSLRINTSGLNIGNQSGFINGFDPSYTKSSGLGKICIIDPASPETARGIRGASGSLSGALYKQIKGGYDAVLGFIKIKGAHEVIEYDAKDGGHRFSMLSIAGPKGSEYAGNRKGFTDALTAVYEQIFEKVSAKHADFDEIRIPVMSGGVFQGGFGREMPEITATAIHKASENVAAKGVTLPMDKVTLCCGTPDFKARVDAQFDRIQGVSKSGGAPRPAGR